MRKQITELRELMAKEGIDACYFPSGDFHGSEYVNEYFKATEYISGFTGEAADLLVTKDGAWLWTDGRFFIQAEAQLAGSGIELMRMDEEGVPALNEFLVDIAEKSHKKPNKAFLLAFDGRVVPASFGKKLEEDFEKKDIELRIKSDEDLAGEIWTDRPSLIPEKIWELPENSIGEKALDKLVRVRKEMKKASAEYLILTDLMDTAWLFNLRGSDISYTPVFFAYTLITDSDVRLYLMDGAMDEGLRGSLLPGIDGLKIKAYEDIYEDAARLDHAKTLWIDPHSCNFELYSRIPSGMKINSAYTPVSLMKLVKSDVEIAGMKDAHIKDGLAVTKLIAWLKYTDSPLTETAVAKRLDALRLEQETCFDLSFETISAYGPNGAIVHYAPTDETDSHIERRGFLLLDSGGQYENGTTDITRTVAMGPLTQEMIDDYTLVLKGHIAMAMAEVKDGMDGKSVDDAARKPLQYHGLDFNHGLSHGVGYVLGVHEGPNAISKKKPQTDLKAGMIMSNEPGVYLEGRFGIRIENLVLWTEEESGCLVNEPLTCVPYEREAINTDLLTRDEIEWIDAYHEWVRETLSPLLDEEADTQTLEYLCEATAPL